VQIVSYLIAHISDLHIQPDFGFVHDLVDTHSATLGVIKHINALDQKPGMVVVSGDLTHGAGMNATQNVKSLLSKLTVPYLVCLGNHDNRQDFLDVFGYPRNWESIKRCIDIKYVNGLRFLVLDTVVDDPRSSGISELQLHWLEEQFAADSYSPTFIVMHHPPFETGIKWLDSMGLAYGREAFASLVRSNACVKAILSGHLHRPMFARWCGIDAYAAPSVMNQIDMEFKKSDHPNDEYSLVITSPPGYALYTYDEMSGLSARTVFLGQYKESWQSTGSIEIPSVA